MIKVPPFHPNPDNTHCWQASLRMVLEHFNPEKKWTWEELDTFSGKKEGLWTWPMRSLISLSSHGLNVPTISLWDSSAFIANPEKYLISRLGEEGAKASIANSDINYEVENAKEIKILRERGDIPPNEQRNYQVDDIKKYLANGFLIILWVNSRKLHGKEGYSGHFVVAYHCDDKHIYIHDCGWKKEGEEVHHPELKVEIEHFINSTLSAEGNTNGFYAIKPKEKTA